jgi:hypothetical protein
MSVFVLVFCLSAQSGEACFWDSHEKNDPGFVCAFWVKYEEQVARIDKQ